MTNKTTSINPADLKAYTEWLKANKPTVLKTIKDRSELPTTVTMTDYKGKPTMSLCKGESSFVNKPFTFGKAKAQMIVEQYAAIKSFAESK